MNYKVKVLIIGDSSVGKSSIKTKFSKNEFKLDFLPTVGVDVEYKTIDVDNNLIQFEIYDTAGQERYRSLSASYLRNKDAYMLVYDVSFRKSLENIDYWIQQINNNKSLSDAILVLVGNKADKQFDPNYQSSDLDENKSENPRIITREEGEKFASHQSIKYFETSALTGLGIKECFEYLGREYIKKKSKKDKEKGNNRTFEVTAPSKKKKKCCL